MTKTIEFIFDFGSPNAYLAYHALQPILARTGAALVLTPCLLGGIFKGTGNRAPMEAFADIRGKIDYDMLEMRRFVARHGLTRYRINPNFPINTLQLMRGMIAAGPAAQHTYVEAVLAAMWEDGKAMGDPAVVAAVLREAGLDADAILAAAQTDAVKQALVANTKNAVERGVFGIPTFFVDGEMYFGKERLGQMEEFLRTGVA
jgi:2-hydroxychromene-2-carboxylate isomerase